MSFKITVEGESHAVEIVGRRPRLVVRIDGRSHEVWPAGEVADGRQTVIIGGISVEFIRAHAGDRQFIRYSGRNFEAAIVDPQSELGGAGALRNDIKAPMPGAVVSVHKAVGDAVARGETVVTIESMKLQTALGSPRDGVIAALLKREGERFEKDEVVARLEDLAGEA